MTEIEYDYLIKLSVCPKAILKLTAAFIADSNRDKVIITLLQSNQNFVKAIFESPVIIRELRKILPYYSPSPQNIIAYRSAFAKAVEGLLGEPARIHKIKNLLED